MSNKPPLSDFLAELPALLQAVSQRVLRALIALGAHVAKLAHDVVTAVANFFVQIVRWVWLIYCRLELSIVDALSTVLVIAWSLRLFALVLLPAIVLVIFRYWIVASFYVAVLALAIWRFYSAKAEDVKIAREKLAPVHALLNKLLLWVLRALLLALSIVSAAMFLSSSGPQTSLLKEQWNRVASYFSDGRASSHDKPQSGRDTSAPRLNNQSSDTSTRRPAPPPPTTKVLTPSPSAISRESDIAVQAGAISIDKVYAANLATVTETLAVASTGQSTAIVASARAACRSFDLAATISSSSRDRKTARPVNDEAKVMFSSIGADQDPTRYQQVVEVQRRAFAADPGDIEIAGDLAIYLLRAGDPDSAYKYAIYAMSLPRSPKSPGRTTDWSTIAAALASRGDQERAASALFVTLAISKDISKRCATAVRATRLVYGPVLRQATEAMFQRVNERQLSDAPECALPIVW